MSVDIFVNSNKVAETKPMEFQTHTPITIEHIKQVMEQLGNRPSIITAEVTMSKTDYDNIKSHLIEANAPREVTEEEINKVIYILGSLSKKFSCDVMNLVKVFYPLHPPLSRTNHDRSILFDLFDKFKPIY